MGSPTFPEARINHVAAASCCVWALVSLAVHLISNAVWPAYHKGVLTPSQRRQWCNKIACGLHAAVLSAAQAPNLFDPTLNSDPLHGVTDSHFFWGSVLLGYLAYDTAYSLACFPLRSGGAMLVHHAVGIAGCVIGLHFNKLALFGLAIEVFFESCNPLLHMLGCMRIAGRTQGAAYRALSRLFVAQFFLFRVVIANGYFLWLLRIVIGLQARPWWAWAGAAVFGLLNCLNSLWLLKLVRMVAREEGRTTHSRSRSQAADACTAPTAADAVAHAQLAPAAATKGPGAKAGTVALTASSRTGGGAAANKLD